MKNIKFKLLGIFTTIQTFMMSRIVCAMDIGDPTKIDDALEKAKPIIEEVIKPISAILIFLAIIILGINIIVKRNKADERMGAISGLLTVAIGAFILGSAGLIYSFVMSIAG